MPRCCLSIKQAARRGRTILLVCAPVAVLLAIVGWRPAGGRFALTAVKVPQRRFLRYEPSAWEEAWWGRRHEFVADPAKLCRQLEADADTVARWVGDATAGAFSAPPDPPVDASIFSRLVYEVGGSGEEVAVAIEPLVGHFRNPFVLSDCRPPDAGRFADAGEEDRSYILLGGVPESLFPGRRFLFDMGTASFPSSLGWFVQQFGERGVQFDGIWAWELAKMDTDAYWKEVPEAVKPRLNFFNVGVSFNRSSPEYVFNIMRELYRPGDYIALKLDIDTANEFEFMEHMLEDASIRAMVAEVFHELHYHNAQMNRFGWASFPLDYAEVADALRGLRMAGILLHYWP